MVLVLTDADVSVRVHVRRIRIQLHAQEFCCNFVKKLNKYNPLNMEFLLPVVKRLVLQTVNNLFCIQTIKMYSKP